VDEHEHAATGENDHPPASPDPFLAPRVALDYAPAQKATVRPSYGLIAVLSILQVGLAFGFAMGATAFGSSLFAVASWPLGALVGAGLLGVLETSRRPGVRTVVSRTQLALSSAVVCATLGMLTLVLQGMSLTLGKVPRYWLGAALAITIFGLLHFALTLLGLWLGSQVDFSSPDQRQ
jgi:hypothetical protein